MWDWLTTTFDTAISSTASFIDETLLGYGAMELGPAETFLMGGGMGDIAMASDPTWLGSLAYDAASLYNIVQPYASKAMQANELFGDKGASSYFQTPKYGSARSALGAMPTTGSFRAGQAAAFVGASDPRVVSAYQRAKASSNPSLQAAMSFVSPTISGKSPTIGLGESSIKSLTKKGL